MHTLLIAATLIVAIWFTAVNAVLTARGASISWINFLVMASAIVAFIWLKGWL